MDKSLIKITKELKERIKNYIPEVITSEKTEKFMKEQIEIVKELDL